MKAWLSGYNADLSYTPASPEDLAQYELSAALPGLSFHIVTKPDLGEDIVFCMNPMEAIPFPEDRPVFFTARTR